MATARCYTKSGSIEKYESNLWSSPSSGNWSTMAIVGKITTPDSNGNYTVTPANNYTDSNETTTYYCFTEYGGNKKTFYFKEFISIIKYVISIIDGPSYNYDDSQYTNNEDAEQGTIYISNYKCIKVVAYYSDNTSKTLSFDDSDNPGFNIYISYKYHKYKYNVNTKNYDVIEDNILYKHLSSTQETYIGNTKIERVIFHGGDKDDIEKDEGDSYEFFKIIDGITQINGIPVEH